MHIEYRQVNGPPDWMDDVHWQVELHSDEFESPYPVALAWVSVLPPPPPERAGEGFPPVLDFILVPDHCRREGYATLLIRECQKRWPDIWLSDPISKAGEGLLRSLGGRQTHASTRRSRVRRNKARRRV
jgi:hypothetical protein